MILDIFARNRFLFWFLSMPILLAISIFMLRTNIFRESVIDYDTIGGQKISHTNFYEHVEKVPDNISYKVLKFFEKYPDSKALLLEQDVDLSNVGNVFLRATKFFNFYNIKNLGKLNYVFRLPDSDYFMKICGPNNRFFYSVHSYGINGINLYIRHVQTKKNGKIQDLYDYTDINKDKERIKNMFYFSCSKDFLENISSEIHVKEIIKLVAGALPQAALRGFVYSYLERKFLLDSYNNNSKKTIKDVFEDVLEYSFYLVNERCYKKNELDNEKFVDSYNIANRVFCCKRFKEAIEKFNLDKLAKPPKSYMLNVNLADPAKLCSCADKDVVLVQEIIEDLIPFSVFLKNKSLLNKVFSYDAVKQLLQAMKYAGLWDVTGENIQVNKKTGKITYIDFEPKNDVLPDQWFNKSEYKRKMNLGYLMLQFTKRFEPGTPQRAAVDNFISENRDIDLDWYNREFKKKKSKHKFNKRGWAMDESLLGRLLYYEDYDSKQALALRGAIGKKLEALG